MTLAILIIFIIGYTAIAIEHYIKVNKAASALLTGVLCWTVYILSGTDPTHVSTQLMESLSEISGILFFLLGAMTVVELIDAHDGFEILTTRITTTSKRKLLWIVSIVAFLLSAVLDNLTTTIVMVSLLRKLVPDKKDRMLYIGIVILAANAGGAWSPIGDVTTTMLWIGGQITSLNIITKLIVPSLVCLILPMSILSFSMKGNIEPSPQDFSKTLASKTERTIVFFLGLAVLLFVPVFKTLTHLPPFMGILFGLAVLWVVIEIMHRSKESKEKGPLSVVSALQKIDTPSILFFLGILVAIAALQSTGQLKSAAQMMNDKIGDMNIIVMAIGLLSSIVDNVPLVAASIGMYDLSQYPTDHYFWEFLAYCTGTGGSTLIIGSAAGVAAMGMEKIDFFWYLKKISWLALIGYFAGAFVYMMQETLFHKI